MANQIDAVSDRIEVLAGNDPGHAQAARRQIEAIRALIIQASRGVKC